VFSEEVAMTDGNRTNPLLLILALIGVIAVLGWLGMSLMHGSVTGGGMGGGMMSGGWPIGILVVVAVVVAVVLLMRRR
jgi:uncharacterized membrane protein